MTLEAVSDIKIIVKQLQGLNKYDLTRPQAGSLTQATYNAMKTLVDRSSPAGSKVCDKKDKTGHSYVRTDDVTGHTFHVLKSSGKHLNAVVSFLEWFKENANRVLEQRDADLNQSVRSCVFRDIAMPGRTRLTETRDDEVVQSGKGKAGFWCIQI